jgi:hypothetical protein
VSGSGGAACADGSVGQYGSPGKFASKASSSDTLASDGTTAETLDSGADAEGVRDELAVALAVEDRELVGEREPAAVCELVAAALPVTLLEPEAEPDPVPELETVSEAVLVVEAVREALTPTVRLDVDVGVAVAV